MAATIAVSMGVCYGHGHGSRIAWCPSTTTATSHVRLSGLRNSKTACLQLASRCFTVSLPQLRQLPPLDFHCNSRWCTVHDRETSSSFIQRSRTVAQAADNSGPPSTGVPGARFVVTGGTGFLGTELCRQLIEEGCRVASVVRGSALGNDVSNVVTGVEHVTGSILDEDRLRESFAGAAGVFHLAGVVEHSRRRSGILEEVHVNGTLAVLRACKAANVRRVVYASTSGVVGVSKVPDQLADDNSAYAEDIVARWPYYASKVRAEKAALNEAQELGLDLVVMRPTLIIGPGDFKLSSTRVIADIIAGRVPLLPSGGLSIVDVRDTAEAFVTAMERGRPGETYLLSAGNLTLAEYFKIIGDVAGVSTPTLTVPDGAARMGARALSRIVSAFGSWDPSLDPVYVEMSQHFWYISAEKAQRELGFLPRSIQESVSDTVDFQRKTLRTG